MDLLLRKNPLLRFLELTLSSKFYIISMAKHSLKKIGALIRSMKFLSPEIVVSV